MSADLMGGKGDDAAVDVMDFGVECISEGSKAVKVEVLRGGVGQQFEYGSQYCLCRSRPRGDTSSVQSCLPDSMRSPPKR